MQTQAEILTNHSELSCSTSIERIVTGRDTALNQIEQLIQKLDAISRLTSEIGGGTAQVCGSYLGLEATLTDIAPKTSAATKSSL